MEKKLKILLCPLDWGIGHASRCVPVIQELLSENHEVIIAADKLPLEFLKKAFPGLHFVRFPGYRITYPEKGNMALKMITSSPAIIRGIIKEHRQLQGLIKKHDIDLVISDNRFGLWNHKVPSIYITHLLMIKAPSGLRVLEPLIYRIHRMIIRQYDECWIPDVQAVPNLSGDLSHKYCIPGNAAFIGPLSRFRNYHTNMPKQEEFLLLVLISGPEPQRTVFEGIILDQLRQCKVKSVVLRGLPGRKEKIQAGSHVRVYSHLPDDELVPLIREAGIIIARPGYSTIMDLVALRKHAILVPTPGQTEQKYLAKYLSSSELFDVAGQDQIDIQEILDKKREWVQFPGVFNINLLRKRIQELSARYDH